MQHPDAFRAKLRNMQVQWIQKSIQSLKSSFTHTPRSLKLAWQSSPTICIIISFLTLSSALFPLGIAYVGKLIVDSVVAGSRSDTIYWVLIELAVVVLQALNQRALFLYRSLLGAKLGLDVNIKILEKALTLDLKHFEDSEFYDQLTKARREASSRPVSMVTDLLTLAQNILTLAGYIALLVSFSFWAVPGLVLAALPATISEMKFSNLAFRLRNWRSADTRRLNYVEYILATDMHAKEVKVLNLGPTLLQRYKRLGTEFYNQDKKLSVERSVWAYLLSLLASGAFYICYLAIAVATATGKLSLGSMTLYIVAFRQGQQAFQSCLTAVGSMYEHNLYMSNLFEYFSIPTGRKEEAKKPKQPTSQFQGLQFEDVGFQYPDQTTWALRNITLEIPAGQSLALVGHNGAGKTTLIKLLTRLYTPTEGRILLDGKDLEEWDEVLLLKRISVVFQDFNRYQLSFGENIGLGHVTFLEDEERIQKALALSGGTEILESLDEGLKTPLGRWFLKGKELSGGQWQKIALARAFMREESDILILDEPTAALDAEAEQAVFERFRELTKGRTAILISHRFPTVRMADRIIVVEGGKIIEQGTHTSLINAKGRYAELFALQASGYV